MATKTAEPRTMQELVDAQGDNLVPFKEGEMVEGAVLEVSRGKITVDLRGIALGMIPAREFSSDVAGIEPGDVISAHLISLEGDNGTAILSLKRAEKDRMWQSLKTAYEDDQTVSVKVMQANRGGLLVAAQGTEGFIPVSQLAAKHYPRVSGGDRDEILKKLQSLVGTELEVKILTFEPNQGKLIFSEKAAGSKELETLVVGAKLTGTVTGIVDFGLFVNCGEGIEGLVHISEVSWDRVIDLKDHFKVEDKVEVQVLGVDRGRVSLSIKQLLPDPWKKATKGIEIGKKIKGEVVRITQFGAFVKLNETIEGLCHISQMGEKIADPKEVVSEGKSYKFEVLTVNPDAHKVALKLIA